MTVEAARLAVVIDSDTTGAESGMERVTGALGKTALAAGALAATVGGGTLAATMSLQDALAPMGTLLGTGSTQFAELSAAVTDFAKGSPTSVDEIGGAAYMALSAGITDTKGVLDELAASQKLAAAGLGSMGESTDLITSAMNSFKSEGLTADEAAQAFFGTIASGKTTTSDLAQGFGQIAPLANAAGIKFTDLLAATAAMTSTGQSASVAYSGLRGAITAVLKPTAEAGDAAAQLGLDFSSAHLAAVGLPAFLDEVKTATGGNVDTMAQLFGGVEGLNAVLALTGPQADAFAANLTGIGDAGQNLDARSKEVTGTLSNRFKTLKNNVTVSLGEIGLNLVGVGDAFLKGGLGSDGFNQAIGKLPGPLQGITRGAFEVVQMIRDHWPEIKATAETVLQALSDGLHLAADAVRMIVDYVREHWPEIRATIDEVVTWFLEEAWPVIDDVITLIRDAFEGLVDWTKDHWELIRGTVTDAIEAVRAIVQSVTDVIKGIWRRFGDEITEFIRTKFEAIGKIAEGGLEILRGIFQVIKDVLTGKWGEVWGDITQILEGVWTAIGGIVESAMADLRLAIEIPLGLLKEAWDLIWGGITDAVSDAFGNVAFIVGITWGAIKTFITDTLDDIGTAWTDTWQAMSDFVGDIWSGITGTIKTGVNGFIDAINAMIKGVNDLTRVGKKTVLGITVFPGWDGLQLPTIPHLAKGGTIIGDGMALVGERGPELLNLNRGAQVLPLTGGRGVGAGRPVVLNVYANPASDLGEIGRATVAAIQQFERLNGTGWRAA